MSDIVKELFLTVDVIIGVDPFCSSETVVLFVFSFVLVFGKVFKLCDIAMIFTRAFSFYIPLIISGIIILIVKVFNMKKH